MSIYEYADVIANLVSDSLLPEKPYDAGKSQLSSADVTAFLNKYISCLILP